MLAGVAAPLQVWRVWRAEGAAGGRCSIDLSRAYCAPPSHTHAECRALVVWVLAAPTPAPAPAPGHEDANALCIVHKLYSQACKARRGTKTASPIDRPISLSSELASRTGCSSLAD